LRLNRIAYIFNSTQVELLIFSTWCNSIQLKIESTQLNSSRKLNIENFPIFDFCFIFLHYLLIESHKEKHEDHLIKSYKEKHEEKHEEKHKEKHKESHEEKHEEKHREKHKESHDEKHKEKHEEEYEEETWRSFDFDRKSWRENMIEDHEDCSIKLFTFI